MMMMMLDCVIHQKNKKQQTNARRQSISNFCFHLDKAHISRLEVEKLGSSK